MVKNFKTPLREELKNIYHEPMLRTPCFKRLVNKLCNLEVCTPTLSRIAPCQILPSLVNLARDVKETCAKGHCFSGK